MRYFADGVLELRTRGRLNGSFWVFGGSGCPFSSIGDTKKLPSESCSTGAGRHFRATFFLGRAGFSNRFSGSLFTIFGRGALYGGGRTVWVGFFFSRLSTDLPARVAACFRFRAGVLSAVLPGDSGILCLAFAGYIVPRVIWRGPKTITEICLPPGFRLRSFGTGKRNRRVAGF